VTRRPTDKEIRTVNKVLLTGRLTRDPEMRALASGKHVTQFSVATNEYAGNGKERPEYHNVVTWDRLAEICGRYLGKGQQIALEGRIQTRTWDDDKGARHWKTEIVATSVEMLSGRRKKDYAAESAADGLEAQVERLVGVASSEVGDDDEAAAAAAADPIPEAVAA
jgi:single-strand DNA-binding protein